MHSNIQSKVPPTLPPAAASMARGLLAMSEGLDFAADYYEDQGNLTLATECRRVAEQVTQAAECYIAAHEGE